MRASALRAFRTVVRTFEQLTTRQNRTCCAGVTLAQCHALLELGAQGETTTQRLARALRLEKSTVSWTIDALVKRGLVRRSPHASDRRIVLLTLTKEGRARYDAINQANDEYYARIFEKIPRRSRQAVIEGFTLLVQTLEDDQRQRAGDTPCCQPEGQKQ